MPGLTNYYRHKVLGSIGSGEDVLAIDTWVTLFSVEPSSDGDLNGGPLDAIEWAPARVAMIREGTVPAETTPRWQRLAGPFGGWQMRNVGTVAWEDAETTALPEPTLLVAGGVFDAEVGGNLVAWDFLEQPVQGVPGIRLSIPTEKLVIRLHKELVT